MSRRVMGRTRLLMRPVYHGLSFNSHGPPLPVPPEPSRSWGDPRGAPGAVRSGRRLLRGQAVEALLEPAGVRALGAGQGLEPLGDLLEALLAGGLREARVHRRVLVGLTGDRGLEV